MNTIDPTAWRDGGEIGGWNVTLNPSAGSAWVQKDEATYYGVTYTNVRQLIDLTGDEPSLAWDVSNNLWSDDRPLSQAAKAKIRQDIDNNVLPNIPNEWADYVNTAKRAADRERIIKQFEDAIARAVYVGSQIVMLDDGADYDAYPDQADDRNIDSWADFSELTKLAELAELTGAGSPELTGADGAEQTGAHDMVRRQATIRGEVNPDRIARYLPSNYRLVWIEAEGWVIEGEDNAGWTLDGYVIPRLASGLIFAEEVTQS